MTKPWLIPQQWLPVDAPLKNDEEHRGRQAVLEVVAQFDLGTNVRYARVPPKPATATTPAELAKTMCNIWIWDYSRAMTCEIPHWVDRATRSMPVPVGKGDELDANAVGAWLAVHGAERGWMVVDPVEALFATEHGRPTVGGWINPTGIGHVVACVPALFGSGLHCAQAGHSNFVNAPVSAAFGPYLKDTIFYTHP